MYLEARDNLWLVCQWPFFLYTSARADNTTVGVHHGMNHFSKLMAAHNMQSGADESNISSGQWPAFVQAGLYKEAIYKVKIFKAVTLLLKALERTLL